MRLTAKKKRLKTESKPGETKYLGILTSIALFSPETCSAFALRKEMSVDPTCAAVLAHIRLIVTSCREKKSINLIQ